MDTNTLISVISIALGGLISIAGVYTNMSIRIALLKQDVNHLKETTKELTLRAHRTEEGLYMQVQDIHAILTDLKVTIESLKKQNKP